MPVDVNGVSQHAVEHLHRLDREFDDLESCVLRLTNVYGPRATPHRRQPGVHSDLRTAGPAGRGDHGLRGWPAAARLSLRR